MTVTPTRRLEWSAAAQAQLQETLQYYAEHSSVAVAARVLARIRAQAEELRRFPSLGVAVPGLDGTFRRVNAGQHVIFYRVVPDQPLVRILTVRHGRRQPLSGTEIAALDEDLAQG